jgi:hypothetical protein
MEGCCFLPHRQVLETPVGHVVPFLPMVLV